MIGERVHAWPGRHQQVSRLDHPGHGTEATRRSLADRAGAEDHEPGGDPLDEGMEYLEITSIRRGVVAGRRSPHRREIRLVHEFRGRDAAAERLRVLEKPASLVGRPYPGGVARPRARREGRHDPRVHRAREVHHVLPLRAGQNAAEAFGR